MIYARGEPDVRRKEFLHAQRYCRFQLEKMAYRKILYNLERLFWTRFCSVNPASPQIGVVNGPPKNPESLGKFYPSLGISQNFLMGLGVSDFVSVGHINAFLLSPYTFSSQARILRCQSRRFGESRILLLPPLQFDI